MIVKLFDFLKLKGIEVYFVGQHKGECTSKYVVLKDSGTSSLNGKNGKGYIDVLFFIPQNRFTQCEQFKKEVKGYIKEFNKLKYTGNETGIVTDDEKKALTFSVLYELSKKMEG